MDVAGQNIGALLPFAALEMCFLLRRRPFVDLQEQGRDTPEGKKGYSGGKVSAESNE